MRDEYSHIGLARLCAWFGLTRQAYYRYRSIAKSKSIEEDLLLQEILNIRKSHRRMGTRKLYDCLRPFMTEHGIKLGRDSLFSLVSAHNLQVRRRRSRVRTTQSYHWLRTHPNRIRNVIPDAPNQIWVSDITYWKLEHTFVYISFITDAYSRAIVGYHVAPTLQAVESIQALRMALASVHSLTGTLIHHSDRGMQYCSKEYVEILQSHGILISMTEHGDPLENAIAERVNGILKDEYLHEQQVQTLAEARLVLEESVRLYNTERPHMSIGNRVPLHVHRQETTDKEVKRLWRNYYRSNQTAVHLYQDEVSSVLE